MSKKVFIISNKNGLESNKDIWYKNLIGQYFYVDSSKDGDLLWLKVSGQEKRIHSNDVIIPELNDSPNNLLDRLTRDFNEGKKITFINTNGEEINIYKQDAKHIVYVLTYFLEKCKNV